MNHTTMLRAFLERSFRFSKQSGPRKLAVVSTLGWMTAAPSLALTLCDGKDDDQIGDLYARLQKVSDQLASTTGGKLQEAVDSGVPTQVSYGFVCGYCSGYAAKKAGKVAAIVFGLGFMSLQSLSYMGYVKVDHGRLKEDMERLLDLNSDGKVDKDDVDLGYKKVMKVLAFNLPAGGGFGAGFMGGLRTG